MQNIKINIQQTAIRLYNEKGISMVSMKQIADALNISAGNLRYHYKTKSALLLDIYKDMHEETVTFIMPNNEYITLHHLERMMLNFYAYQKRYAFFFQDLSHIAQVYPDVMEQLQTSNLLRFKEGRQLIDYYVATDRMYAERNGVNYDKLMHNIWMVSIFWLTQSKIISTSDYTVNKGLPTDLIWDIVIPHLTSKGLEEFQQMKKFVKINS